MWVPRRESRAGDSPHPADCLLTSCLSATREREANCLATTIMDVWQTEHEVTSAEQVWRSAQQFVPNEQPRVAVPGHPSAADAPPIIRETAARFESFGFPRREVRKK